MARRLILFLLALGIALLGSGAVFAYASAADDRAMADQQPVDVLMAKDKIPAGTTALDAQTEGLVEIFAMPRRAVPEGALTSIEGVEEYVTTADVLKGEVLLAAKFVNKSAAAVAGVLPIPEGKMAVSVSLEDPARVGGFVEPGSEVAIFDTFNAMEMNQSGPKTPAGNGLEKKFEYNRATRMLLPRVQVIAVGDRALGATAEEGDDPTSKPVTTDTRLTLTLAVDQDQAERLIQGTQTGALYFGLLTTTSKTKPSDGVDNRDLFNTK